MTTSEIRTWLSTLDGGTELVSLYAASFESEAITLSAALLLEESDLKDLGVTKMGHRKIILGAIRDLRSSRASSTASTTTASSSPSSSLGSSSSGGPSSDPIPPPPPTPPSAASTTSASTPAVGYGISADLGVFQYTEGGTPLPPLASPPSTSSSTSSSGNTPDEPIAPSELFITDVKLGDKVGEGSFGQVHRALWHRNVVAAKRTKESSASGELVSESKTLLRLRHPNVVTFYGLFVAPETHFLYLVSEFMHRGSLDSLLERQGPSCPLSARLCFARDACAGMVYLSSVGIVHRDLAARNILLTDGEGGNLVAKVADFGLSRVLSRDTDYYRSESGVMPIRWSSPEALQKQRFSPKSDSWSFGVLCWEIFANAERPYDAVPTKEVLPFLLSGKRLVKPAACPDEIYRIMSETWLEDPDLRPDFNTLFDRINAIAEMNPPPPPPSVPPPSTAAPPLPADSRCILKSHFHSSKSIAPLPGPFRIDEGLFVGTAGYVAAYWVNDTPSPREVWRCNLEGTQHGITTVICVPQDGPRLYAGCSGHVFALDPATGAVFWRAPPPKGFHHCPTVEMVAFESNLLISGKWSVACLLRANGQVVWIHSSTLMVPGNLFSSVTLRIVNAPIQRMASSAPHTLSGQSSSYPYPLPPPPEQMASSSPSSCNHMSSSPVASSIFSMSPIHSFLQGSPPPPVLPPGPTQPIVLAGSAGTIHALNLSSGSLLWKWSQCPVGSFTGVSVTQDPLGNIHAATNGTMYLVNPANGAPQMKSTNLKKSRWHAVAMALTPTVIYAAARGYVYALDTATHAVKWRNELQGCGFSNGLSLVVVPAAEQTVSAIVAGINGKVAFICPAGQLLKVVPLPGCGFGHVSVFLDQDTIIASCNGHVYGVALNGSIAWHSNLPGIGHGYVSFSTIRNNIDHNSCSTFADADETAVLKPPFH